MSHVMEPWNKEETVQDRGGFTLLELLMVVIIIAILASVALPQYFRAAERARSGEALSNLAAIRGAEIRFRANSAGNIYSVNLTNAGANALDVDVPQLGTAGAPGTANWNFTVSGTTATDDLVATRRNAGAAQIKQDLTTGVTCGTDAQYGLNAAVTTAACAAGGP